MIKRETPLAPHIPEPRHARTGMPVCALALLAILASPAVMATVQLAAATDLRAHARRAQALGQPLVVLVSLPDCAFCERVKRSHLLPMASSGRHQIREVMLNGNHLLRDFDGNEVRAGDWARSLGTKVAPTVHFLAPDGRAAAQPLVGAGLEDFYGSYLEQRLRDARAALPRKP